MEKIVEALASQNANQNSFENNIAELNLSFSEVTERVSASYDNEGACKELEKDMARKDNLSLRFYKDKEGYLSVQVESKNVAPYKVQLNQSILSGLMNYIATGIPSQYDHTPMEATNLEDEVCKTVILKKMVTAGKQIQWTPLFRERNGKISGVHVARYGKVFFYVNYSDELIDWLREMKQAI